MTYLMQQKSHRIENDNGPWQDGWYVVASPKTQMPSWCMVCGEDVDVLETTPVPLPRLARGILSGTYWLLEGDRFLVHYGRCEQHRVPWSKYLGVVTGITSIVTMIASTGSLVVAKGFGVWQAVLVGAFAVSFVATIWLTMTNLRIEKADDDEHVWIGGCGRGFREKLPPLRKPGWSRYA
jgi:hypothetical protein